MDVHLKNNFIESKAQARDSCYGIIFIISHVVIWL